MKHVYILQSLILLPNEIQLQLSVQYVPLLLDSTIIAVHAALNDKYGWCFNNPHTCVDVCHVTKLGHSIDIS